MLSLSNSRIKNGILICIESIKLIYRNPILWTYAIPVALYFIWCPFMPRPLFVEDISSYPHEMYKTFAALTLVVNVFFSCCLARHTMHILRQQPSNLRESFEWIMHHHGKQVMLWIIVAIAVFFLQDLPGSFGIIGAPYVAVISSAIILSACWVGFLPTLLLLFNLHIVIPIIATQVISIRDAIKQSGDVIWNNFSTYLVTQITALVIVILFFIAPSLLFQRFIGFNDYSADFFNALGRAAQCMLFTVIGTIFYYEFYVKHEEVVVYQEQDFNSPNV